MDAFRAKGDFSGLRGDWTMKAACTLGKKTTSAQITVKAPTKEDKNERIVADIDLVDFSVDPLSTDTKVEDLVLPPASGGLLVALYQYRELLAFGEKGFSGDFSHGGVAPFYPPLPGDAKPDYAKQRVMCEVLRTRLAGVPARWYFSQTDGNLLGFEVAVDPDDDPCEVYLSDYHQQDGRSLPGRMEVRFKDKTYAVLSGITWKMEAAK